MCNTCLEEVHAGVIYGLHTGDHDFRYIGKSIDHKKRFKQHIYSALRGVDWPVCRWIRKHGAENIQMTIIETFTEEDLDQMDEREIFHIAQARAYYGKNLNMTDGGEGQAGWVPSEETRRKISEALMGKKHTPETIAKRAAHLIGNKHSLGRKLTEEHKAKIGAASRGNKNALGYKQTPETKAKTAVGAYKARHTRWHTNRGITKPDCTHCVQPG